MNDETRTSKRVFTTAMAGLAAVATLLVVFATAGEPPETAPDRGTPADPGQPAAAGWRWESYGGVDVQVPDTWGYGRTGTPPCLAGEGAAEPRRAYVGRPGPLPAVACAGPTVPPRHERSAYLWFDSPARAGVRAHDHGWVEQTRVVRGLALTVFTDDAALRTRILDSARPASGGGCPVEHPVTAAAATRPDAGPGGLATMEPAESITLCRYAFGDRPRPAASPVLSMSRLSGEEARAVVRAILAAPEGEGPNEPGNCLPEVAEGDEVLLLIVRDRARAQEVFVRYSGCDGHGIDDGDTHRRLTADALRPLLAGPHRPGGLNGAVAALVWS